jgi:hypothetical protein
MPILAESAQSLAARARNSDRPVRIVFRSPDQPDVLLVASREGGRFEVADRPAEAATVVATDPANRLLVLWGRKSSNRSIEVDGEPAIVDNLAAALWPNAQVWPR